MKRNVPWIVLLLLLAAVVYTLPDALTDRLRLSSFWPTGTPSAAPDNETNGAFQTEQLRLENADLRRRLHLLSRYRSDLSEDVPMLPARIFFRGDTSDWRRTAYIDAGTEQGVTPGMAIADAHGLLGLVAAVSANHSRITMLTDPTLKIRSLVAPGLSNGTNPGVEPSQGVVESPDGNGLKMLFIPIAAPVQTGDPVYTSGRAGRLPRGLPIGWVQRIAPARDGLTHDISLQPSARLRSAEQVVVFLKPPMALEGTTP